MKYFNPKYLQRPGKAKADYSSTKTQTGVTYNTQPGGKQARAENSREPKAPAKPKAAPQEAPKSVTKIEPAPGKHGSKVENALPIKGEPKASLLAEKSASNLPAPKKSDIAKLLQMAEQHNRAETFSNISQPQQHKDAKKSIQPDLGFDLDMKKKSQLNYNIFDGPGFEGQRRNSKPRDSKKPVSETRITPVDDTKSVQTQVPGKYGNQPSDMDIRAMKLEELKKKPPGQLTVQEKEMLKLLSKKKI